MAGFLVELTRPAWSSLTGAVIDLDDGIGLFPGNRPPSPLAQKTTSGEFAPETRAVPMPGIRTITPAKIPSPPANVATDRQDPVLRRVAQVFHLVFGIGVEELTLRTGPEDVARWDSLGNLRLIAELEKEFGCRLDVNEIMEMVDVASIVQILRGKIS